MIQIAHIENDFDEKFAIPRQSGLVNTIVSRIVFEPEFRNEDALRGLEEFSHIWLIWEFSEAVRRNRQESDQRATGETDSRYSWRPTVRPPRLGGNERIGVFATRSPFRPNPIGLSCVKLEGLEKTADCGTVIVVRGADLMNGTPILDIKPYISYSDCHPEALKGFTDRTQKREVRVIFPAELEETFLQGLSCGEEAGRAKLESLYGILAQDPRPAYQDDSERVYTFGFAGEEISFTCDNDCLKVKKITY